MIAAGQRGSLRRRLRVSEFDHADFPVRLSRARPFSAELSTKGRKETRWKTS